MKENNAKYGQGTRSRFEDRERRFNTKGASEFLAELGLKYTPKTMAMYRHDSIGPKYYKLGNKVFYMERDLLAYADLAVPHHTTDSLAAAAAIEASRVGGSAA